MLSQDANERILPIFPTSFEKVRYSKKINVFLPTDGLADGCCILQYYAIFCNFALRTLNSLN